MTFNSKTTIASRKILKDLLLFHTKKKKKNSQKKQNHNEKSHFIPWVVSGLSTRYLLITFIGTFFNSSSVENEVWSRSYILDALSLNFTAYKTHTTSYIMHATKLPCASMTRGRHLVSKAFIYAILHKLLRDVNGRHYNARNSDVSLSRAPCGLGEEETADISD